MREFKKDVCHRANTSVQHKQNKMSLNDTHISPVEDAATFVEDKKDAYPSHHEKVDYNAFKEDAMRAEEEEKSMTLWQNLKTYKKAVFWSFAISLNIIMEGFDLNSM